MLAGQLLCIGSWHCSVSVCAFCKLQHLQICWLRALGGSNLSLSPPRAAKRKLHSNMHSALSTRPHTPGSVAGAAAQRRRRVQARVVQAPPAPTAFEVQQPDVRYVPSSESGRRGFLVQGEEEACKRRKRHTHARSRQRHTHARTQPSYACMAKHTAMRTHHNAHTHAHSRTRTRCADSTHALTRARTR